MLTRQKAGGFTLIEVMVVVAILGILTAIALPMYQESTRKSRRSEAMRELMELASRQERFYAQNSTYTNDITSELGLNWTSDTVPPETTNGLYQLSVDECAEEAAGDFSRCYVLLATPQGDQAKDKCGTLSVDSLGVREASLVGGSCW